MIGITGVVGLVFGVFLAIQPALAVDTEASECHHTRVKTSDGNSETKKDYFELQFAVAERLRQAAATAKAEWLKTEELLVLSRQHAQSNDWKMAFQLVQKACHQAESALQQAEYESGAWRHRVVD